MLALATDAATPSPEKTYATLLRVACVLGSPRCWLHERRYHFAVADGWTIAVSPESAGRFRLDACRYVRPVTTLWTLAGEDGRLAGCVLALRDQIAALAADNGGGADAELHGSEPMA